MTEILERRDHAAYDLHSGEWVPEQFVLVSEAKRYAIYRTDVGSEECSRERFQVGAQTPEEGLFVLDLMCSATKGGPDPARR